MVIYLLDGDKPVGLLKKYCKIMSFRGTKTFFLG